MAGIEIGDYENTRNAIGDYLYQTTRKQVASGNLNLDQYSRRYVTLNELWGGKYKLNFEHMGNVIIKMEIRGVFEKVGDWIKRVVR